MQDFWTALFNKFSSCIFLSSPAFLPSLSLSVKWGGGLKVTEGRCFLSLVLKCFVKTEIVEKDKSTECFDEGGHRHAQAMTPLFWQQFWKARLRLQNLSVHLKPNIIKATSSSRTGGGLPVATYWSGQIKLCSVGGYNPYVDRLLVSLEKALCLL